MSTRPILFNAEMVRAILEGRKTVTRRVVKTAHGGTLEVHDDIGGTARLCERCGAMCKGLNLPYRPGDILWVRETWNETTHGYNYKASPRGNSRDHYPWHPSIHMPKAAARLFLRVTAVRVERLQEISPDQCAKEGLTATQKSVLNEEEYWYWFMNLWNSTIKPADLPRYGWDANPFVWAIEFEQCEKPEGWA